MEYLTLNNGIQASGIDRKELFLVTKVNFKSYENAESTVLQSLQNLQTDYMDLLLLHWPFANYYAAWRSLEKLYADGKIRAIGVSNFEPDQLLDLIAYNNIVPAVNQIETNLYCQRSTERTWMDQKIPRSTQPEHIRENFALFDFTLAPDELSQLSALDKKEPLIGKPETPELVEFSLTW